MATDLHQHSGPQTAHAAASGSAGNRAAFHFGFLDVPQPAPFATGDLRQAPSDQSQRPALHLPGQMSGTDPAVQPGNAGLVHRCGLARSRDGAAAAPSEANRSREALSGDVGSGDAGVSGSWSKKAPPPFRPKAIPLMQSGERPGKATSPRQEQDPVVPMRGVEASKLEGSATSDENNQPRLVPRKGAGPDLRSEGGGKIDEYLMRLLRSGTIPADANQATRTGKVATATTAGKPAQDGGGPQRQGSRLGPLAPGAGQKSSVNPVRPAASTPPFGPWHNPPPPQEADSVTMQTDTAADERAEPGRPARRSMASQPSTTGAETSQDPLQKSQSGQFGTLGTSDRETTKGGEQKGSGELPDGDKGNGSSTGQQQSMQSGLLGLADKARQVLGDQLWLTLRQTMAAQAQELQQQLHQLHHLAGVQQQLQSQHGTADCQGSRSPQQGAPPPLFVGQSPAARPQAPANGSAWWLNAMPWVKTFGSEATNWPVASNGPQSSGGTQRQARPRAPPPSALQDALTETLRGDWLDTECRTPFKVSELSQDLPMLQGSMAEPQQQLSRTTQIALDAQRRRRSHKSRGAKSGARSQDTSRSEQQGQPQSKDVTATTADEDVKVEQPQQGQQQGQQQPATWFSLMQPYLSHAQQQAQAQAPADAGRPGNGFDPLTAWYHFHFGQQAPGFQGSAQPASAGYGAKLAGLGATAPVSGWENQCHDYFNFSMPGTSEAKTATTGVTTAKPRISRSDQAVSAAQGLQAFPPQAAGQQQTPFQNSAGGQMLPPRTNGSRQTGRSSLGAAMALK